MISDLRTTIRARAPLRLGLAGGGTDLSPYCDEFGGAVLNTTIDRFAYAFITPRDDGKIAFCAKDLNWEEVLEAAPELPQARLLLHRGVYERMVRDHNRGEPIAVTITTTVDAPLGSGLGSSSALVVALVDAFRLLFGAPLGQYDVAHLAFEIERLDLELAGGRQDQYSAAFGGTNFIEFLAKDRVIVNPLRVSDGARNELEIFARDLLFRALARRLRDHRAADFRNDGSQHPHARRLGPAKGRRDRNEKCAARWRRARHGAHPR